MRTTEIGFEGRMPVDGYGAGGFRIGGAVYRGPVALVPEGVLPWAGMPDFGLFLERAAEFDVLLVGTGGTMLPPSPAFAAARGALEAAGAGVELMATPQACRTFNVLLAEGRRIAAALTPL
jgi:uncharacterized protein